MAVNVFRFVSPCISGIIFQRRVLNVEYLLIKRAQRTKINISSFYLTRRCYSSLDGHKHKNKLLEKYFAAKEASEVGMPPLDVDPHGVFANNELDLGDIEVYGFDYDYTLAVYKESLHYLIYDLGRDWLLNKFKYPKEIEQLDYRPGFAIEGLHYDIQKEQDSLVEDLSSNSDLKHTENVFQSCSDVKKVGGTLLVMV
ncbi:5'-nucleotidase domain-containing protein 3-like [Tachypleus tridentatus]|uniref:5'-nucleotidase domain-containing protein 3-like n=1 Tax=Tachypleus tridentatus TaxID=6853 RepID=UPI003FCF4337